MSEATILSPEDEALLAADLAEFTGKAESPSPKKAKFGRTIPPGDIPERAPLKAYLDSITPKGCPDFETMLARMQVMWNEREGYLAQKGMTDLQAKVNYQCEVCQAVTEGLTPAARNLLGERDPDRVVKCPNMGNFEFHPHPGLTPMKLVNL